MVPREANPKILSNSLKQATSLTLTDGAGDFLPGVPLACCLDMEDQDLR
jgi:hypothetical protein